MKVPNIIQKKAFDISPMGVIWIVVAFALFFIFLAFGQKLGNWGTGVISGVTAPITDTVAGINWGV